MPKDIITQMQDTLADLRQLQGYQRPGPKMRDALVLELLEMIVAVLAHLVKWTP